MGKTWTDRGNGQWKLTVTSEDPHTPSSHFYGTKDEILDKLADSQAHANTAISQFRRTGNGNGTAQQPPSNQPRPMNAAERMQVAADITNPGKIESAVTRVLESVVGPIENLTDRNDDARASMVAGEWADSTPEWYPSPHNKQALTNYMRTQGFDPFNVESYNRAFDELTAAKLLQPLPTAQNDDDEPEAPTLPERNAPATPKGPTRYSTGFTASDISGTPPAPQPKRAKYSREQIENLSTADYKRLWQTDPEFARSVEATAGPQRRKVG